MKKQNQSKKKIILGITGSFGSGKTTVARMLEAYGAYVINADRLAHQCIKAGSRAYKKICQTFGKGILSKRKVIDRRKLARIVFGNKRLLRKLNQIVHPEVIRIIRKRIRSSKCKIVVLDVPLLLEAGLQNLVDKLIVVTINRQEQVERLRKKSRLSRIEILERIKSQIPLPRKVRVADFVIDNNSNKGKTRKQVAQIRRKLWKS